MVAAGMMALLLAACDGSSPVAVPSSEPGPLNGVVPNFSLLDVNPNSPRSGQTVAVRDYQGWVSAWYFGAST
jgi:hypothetical protein